MALDLSSLRAQLPGLANRPNFPSDLSVLLLDPDFKARQEVEAQLKENNYAVTPCSCSFEAAAHLQDADKHFDLLLADVRCMQQQSAEHKAVVQAAKSIPLVLMSESGAPNEVMLGIKLGAVDFLEKPLSPLKLKNIWQHLVRRMLSASAKAEKKAAAHTAQREAANNAAGSATASPEDSGSHGHDAAHSAGFCGGESGSHASTSDQAQVKAALMDCDADMETSSIDCMEALTAGMARASAADSTMHADIPGAAGPSTSGGSPHPKCASRPHALKYKASRLSMPGNTTLPSAAGVSGAAAGTSGGSDAAATTTASVGAVGGGSAGSSGAPKPAMGYPAGQMPALPSNIPGIAWGLPTNPLQISPKAPAGMSGLMASMPMGWPMGPMGPMPPPAAFFSMMMGGGSSSSPSVSSMAGCPSGPLGATLAAATGSVGAASAAGAGGGMPPHHHGSLHHGQGLHGSASCMTLPSMAGAAAAAAAAAGNALCMKRADSAPLPAISGGCLSLGSAATTMTGMGMGMGSMGSGMGMGPASMDVLGGMGMGAASAGLMPPPAARPPTGPSGGGAGSGQGMSKADLFAGMGVGGAEGGRGTMPPIGLSLKKSPSLVDIISQTLKHSGALPAY
ncbi:hypothetical protein HXX76_002132 [Chlamydomonas incerta]|uniref:Response regulatory domain-containing protein n=1 Tax=Chlamydomonas incerta TaxID=51695 RepID=A0A835WAH3_CHLIN|nr:hypothetical protein HXX76_002132 [Chlamydomonas incerta]|eukprot:KAG2443789.1 hypothetical protein HXX76_002132 [Chlamydomonas incerta]